jgi:hypothetical protein
MSDHNRFRINQPTIISEVIEREAILINLDTGAYYSLREAGADVWQMLEQGASMQQMVEQLACSYPTPPDKISAGLEVLLSELLDEGLILSVSHGTQAEHQLSLPAPAPQAQAAFPRLVLEKYTDMSELLMLDPIHEVNEPGWPSPIREEPSPDQPE